MDFCSCFSSNKTYFSGRRRENKSVHVSVLSPHLPCLSAVSLPSFPFQFSVPICGNLYLDYFRKILAVQHQRQSLIHSKGHFNISKAFHSPRWPIQLEGKCVFWHCIETVGQIILKDELLYVVFFHFQKYWISAVTSARQVCLNDK